MGLSFLICKTGSLCSGSPYTRQRMAESDVSGPCDERDPAGLSLSSLPSRDKWAEKEERVRRAVTRVLKCDVLKEQPLEPAVLPPADGLISSLCLEAACPTPQACRDALRHLRTLLRPGGHLVLSGSFESTFFMVGDKRFPTLPLNEKFLREALQEAGFIIEKLEKVARATETHLDNRTDYTGLFFLVAQKGD